jgi:hypothetical protein
VIAELTQVCLPNCPGFFPHAFRHIIATDYIKNHPNGFAIAARILHDREETVRTEYAHVKVAYHFPFWTDYHEDRLRAWHGDVVLMSAAEREQMIKWLIDAMPGNSRQDKVKAVVRHLENHM